LFAWKYEQKTLLTGMWSENRVVFVRALFAWKYEQSLQQQQQQKEERKKKSGLETWVGLLSAV